MKIQTITVNVGCLNGFIHCDEQDRNRQLRCIVVSNHVCFFLQHKGGGGGGWIPGG